VKRWLFIDKSICTGCRYCEAVCSLVHSQDNQVNPKLSLITVHQDLRNGNFTPVVCRQCAKPPCVDACLFEAMSIDPVLGIPTIASDKCTGCKACLEACPFGAMFFDDEREIAMKCDLCGGEPQCVKFCRALPHVGYAALSYVTPEQWLERKIRLNLRQTGKPDINVRR
jgi:carbon-monoxide dehydrogenase iron sulfur subunit